MTQFEKTLPPLLEQQLARILRRYRRLRALRAGARFLLFFLPLLALFAALAALKLPVAPALLLVLFAAATLGVAAYTLGALFSRPVTLREIAAHIDRHHPELQDRILSAVALTESPGGGSSSWMLENFLADTQRNVKGVPLDSFISPREYQVLMLGVALCGVLIIGGGLAAVWKLGYVRSAMGLDDPGVRAIEFSVEPGDATVQPGENQIIWVTSPDTNATKYIFWEQGGQEGRAVLASSSTPDVSFHTFQALQEGLRYQVRVADVTSDWYEIRVSRPPGVTSIQLQYDYPAYLALEPKVVPFGGDIAAVEGTRVTVRLEANKALESARLVRDSGAEIPMTPLGEVLWETRLDLDESGSYHLALIDGAGEANPAPEEFAIEVLPDNPPDIRVRFPRGDAEVLALEEVPLAFEVEDDFGISEYGVEYTVAGREPVRLALNAGEDILQQVAGDHLLALEEMGLEGGDLITWSIWARDKKPDRQDYEIQGDPFFLEVRPYVRRYRERITSGGGGAAADMGGQDMLSDQRGIVIALHNLRKEASGMGAERYGTDEGRIAEAQQGIRVSLVEALGRAAETEAEIGAQAVEAMGEVLTALEAAAWPAPEPELGDAVTSAQRTMQLLIKLEPELRTVTRSESQGGGGGGGGGASQPEIDELEMERRQDYQEDARTGAEAAAESEEIRKGLEDLARRQEILNDDLGKLLSEDEKTMDELERKRQLERLREEQERQLERLDELANRLAQSQMDATQRQQATEEMQRARGNMESSLEEARGERLQQARAAGSRAARQLEQAESGLDALTREAARDRMAALEEEMEAIRERHEAMRGETGALNELQDAPGVDGKEALVERTEALKGEKHALAEATEEMLVGAGGLSDQLRENQELLSRKLGDWTRRTSRTGVVNDMEESVPWIDWGYWEGVRDSESQVQRKLDEAAEALEGLRRFLPGDPGEDMARALDMLNDLQLGGEPGESQRADGEEAGAQRGPSQQGGEESGSQQPGGNEGAGREQEDGSQAAGRSGEGDAQGPGQPSDEPTQDEQTAARQPGEGEAQEGQAPGGQGQEPGEDAQTPAQGEEGQTPGAGPEEQQEGSEQVASRGSESSGASPSESGQNGQGDQGGQGGQGNQQGQGGQDGQPGESGEGTPGEGPPRGGQTAGRGGGNQSPESFWGGGGADSLDDFFDRDVSEWRPALQDAASLLPRESEVRGALEGVELELGRLQREYNNGKKLPEMEEFEQVVRRPLMDSIATLEEMVRQNAEGEQQWLQDEGEIPSQYVDRVAEYFRLLAETPEAP